MSKKRLSLIFLFIAVLSIIIAFNLFVKEQIILDINYINREDFKRAMDTEKIDDIDVNTIRKVKLGTGWHSGDLIIYYNFGKLETRISEGMAQYGNLERYVIENGYSAGNIMTMLILISVFCFIIFYILKKSTRNN